MANINNNIQVSAGLDSSDYLKGAKEVINAQAELNSSLVKGAQTTTAKLEAAVKSSSLGGFKNAGSAAASAFTGALTGGILGAGLVGAITALSSSIGAAVTTAIADLKELGDTAAAVGLTAEELYTFQRVFAEIGVSATQVNSLFDSLFKNIRRGAKEFEDFGVIVKNSDGSFKDINEVLAQTADLMASLEGTTEQAVVAQKLFGDNWKEVLEVLKEGSIALEKNREKADEQAGAAARASEALDRWGDGFSELWEDIKVFVSWIVIATDAMLKFAQAGNAAGGRSASLGIIKETTAAAEVAAKATNAAAEADKARSATAGKVRQTIADLKKVEEARAKAEAEAAKAKEKADKASSEASDKSAAAAEKARKEAERLSAAYDKLRAGGLQILEGISTALEDQVAYLRDLAGYGEEYASTQSDLRSIESARLDSITKLNEQLKQGAINLKEYNKALDEQNKLSEAQAQQIKDAAANKVYEPINRLNQNQSILDAGAGLRGQEYLDALDEAKAKTDALKISTDIFNQTVEGGAAGNVDAVIEYADAIYKAGKAQDEIVAKNVRVAAANEQLINDSLQAFKEFSDALITGSESASDAIKKLAIELLRALLLAKALEFLGGKSWSSLFGGTAPRTASTASGIATRALSSGGGAINVYNYSAAPGGIKATQDSNGNVNIIVGQITSAISQGGNSLDVALKRTYGLTRQGI